MSGQNREADARADDLKRALVAIRELRRQVQQLEARPGEPIAIIGMACRLPGGADTPERFWELVRNGVDATTELPADRWDAASYYDPDPDAPDCMYTNRGGFLKEPVDQFDAAHFGISPREASAMDPVQRMLLELSWEAFERAGIAPQSLHGSDTGVFLGLSGSDYNTLQSKSGSTALNMYSGTGSAHSIAGGRISHCFGLHGPNLSLDTACSSSLVAVVLAAESLRTGKCSMALAGGAQLMLAPDSTIYMCKLRALSPGGRCRTFDAAADGYSRGEGGGMLLLKRLSDAVRDGDPVIAVIRGAAYNHDGHSSGLTVPNPAAQRMVVEAALKNAGLSPNDVDYVEAHGTATPLGDPIEVRALADVLCRSRPANAPLLIGSVKANLGHLEAAAGVTGLMKLALAISKAEIPPHINCEQPTPHVDWDTIPVRIAREKAVWNPEGTRVGGVSAFGLSGTNAHVIVESAPADSRSGRSDRPAELVLLSGRTRDAVRQLAERYQEYIRSSDAAALPDIALTSLLARSPLPFRSTVVAPDPATMAEKLNAITNAPDDAIANVKAPPSGRIAFLFTGQGAQYPGMGRELYAHSAVARSVLDRCDDILRPHMDRSLIELLTTEEDADVLKQTLYAQPALFAVEYALAALWQSWGIKPAAVAGHSLGEYVAATVAGVLSLEDALPLVALRGRLMQALPDGGRMCAVFAPEAQVAQHVAAVVGVAIAAINGPSNTVISGSAAEVGEVLARLQQDGVEGKDLHVSHAFHSALMDPMLDDFEQAIRGVALNAPRIPVISNLTGVELTARDAVDAVRWRRHIREPVRFAQSLRTLFELGARTFLEIGPHPALSAMGMSTLTDAGVRWLPSMRRGRSAWQQLLETVGDLWRAGYEIDVSGFAREHGGRRVAAPTYAFQRSRFWFTDDLPIAPATAPRSDRDSTHPLLGHRVDSPAIDGWVFETELDANSPAYLADHVVGGQVIVPAAVYMKMMLAAALHGPGWNSSALRDFAIERALSLDAGATVCQIIVSQPDRGTARVRIVAGTRTNAAQPVSWATIATAIVQTADAPLSDLPFDRITEEPSQAVDVHKLYDGIGRLGVDYGPSFRTLHAASTNRHGAFGHAELADSDTTDGYTVHPSLIDAAFQLMGALTGTGTGEGSAFLPSGAETVQFQLPVGRKCSIHARLRDTDPSAPDTLAADFTFYTEDGNIAGVISGYHGRRVRNLPQSGRAAAIYQIAFEEVVLETGVAASGTWLLLEDAGGTAASLAAELTQRGADAIRVLKGDYFFEHEDGRFIVRPDDVNAWSRILSKARFAGRPLHGIIHCWSLDPVDTAGDPADALMQKVLDSCVALNGLLRADGRAGASLSIIARCGNSDNHERNEWQHGSPFWGMLPVIRAEYPEIASRIIDLDPNTDADPATVLTAVLSSSDEDRIALRDGRIFVPRLVSATPGRAPATSAINGDGCYVVTGGTGGVGRSLVEWLTDQGAGAVVVAARSALDSETAGWLEALRARDRRVEFFRADAADRDGVAALLDSAQQTGLRVRGVFHVAGVIDDGLIADLDRTRFERVLAPKIKGALNLHAATESLDLDHFVLFSSTASILGGPGQAAYAAGNAFLDALASYRRSRGLPGLSIDWGAWADRGMAARLSDRERQRLEQNGLSFLRHDSALATLRMLLCSAESRAIVAAIDWNRLSSASRSRPLPLLERMLVAPRAIQADNTGASYEILDVAALTDVPPAEREARITAYVLAVVTAVLRLPAAQLDADSQLASTGMDSLMSMELRNRIETDIGVLLPLAVLLQAETPAVIAAVIAGSEVLRRVESTPPVLESFAF